MCLSPSLKDYIEYRSILFLRVFFFPIAGVSCYQEVSLTLDNKKAFLPLQDACLSQSIKRKDLGPGWVAQLVRTSSRYAKAVGLIPGQGTYKNQPIKNSGITN